VKVLAGVEKGLDEHEFERLTVKYKPQYVRLSRHCGWYQSEVLKPLRMELLMDKYVTMPK